VAVRIKKEKELLFGLTTPEKSSCSQSQTRKQKGEEITTPEDLYPERAQKRTTPDNPLANRRLIEALKHNSKVENDDLNFNSEDERDISEMHQNTNLQYSSPMTKGRGGGSNRKKRKENAEQNSQFSVISNYQLRPRNEHSKVSQLTAPQKKALQRGQQSV